MEQWLPQYGGWLMIFNAEIFAPPLALLPVKREAESS